MGRHPAQLRELGKIGVTESMMGTVRRAGIALSIVGAALAAACATATEAAHPAAAITIVGGSGQNGFAGLTLSQPLIVKVTAADGTPVAGQTVDFTVVAGQATLNPPSATTGGDGTAQTQVTLGSGTSSVEIEATVRATTLKAVFTATVQAAAGNITCTSSNTVTLAVGEVRTALQGAGICLHADATSQFMVHAFFESTVPSAQTQVGIAGFGITPGGASAAMGARPSTAVSSMAPTGLSQVMHGGDPAGDLEPRIREFERTVLAPHMAAARTAVRRRGALMATAPSGPPTVGQIIPFDVNETCDSTPRIRGGRVVAVTSKAIVVADTGNPANGFTDAEYQSMGATFDTLVDPLDEAAFGAPTDIDANGHVIILFTRAVNELTPAHSQGIVEGFFNPRDLFPKTGAVPGDHCPESNFAEMFYVLVPDPTGTINGNVRLKTDVQQFTIAVLGHEYQHLINSARRIYVNNANDFEEVWLNEGLSHIAEELLFYKASGLAPRQNIDGPTISVSQQRVAAFNNYQLSNFGRYETFLEAPTTSSPYADNDSLPNRGAIWSFLRYAADHQGTGDGTVWFQLVNSTTGGLANLTNVFGANVLDQIRDWSISVYGDDLASTSATHQQPSWNFRSIYPRIGVASFPLLVFPLTNGSQTTQTLIGGGSLYTTLGIQAGSTAAVAWSVASPNVQISIVRVK